MKRRYAIAAIRPTPEGHAVILDGKPLKTPGRRDFVVPTAVLAAAVAAEWNAQGHALRPERMRLTRLANFAIDRVPKERAIIVEHTARYAETDLVCYRAEFPAALAERQQTLWQPLLDWATRRYDTPLLIATGVIPKRQSPAALRALERAVAGADDLSLAALASVTRSSGSLVIGLALLEGRIDADAAFAACELEESFEIESWGEDDAQAARRREVALEIKAAARLLALLGRQAPT
jgi:chaperone required for assembly of F1-ATPase